MALRKIIASRYSWVETAAGVTKLYTAEKGQHWDFAAGEITKGEAEGALGAADGGAVAATLVGQTVAQTDTVTVQAAKTADPAAIGSTVAAGANPTKAEFDALRTDVVNLRAAFVALTAALQTAGGPQAAA